MGQLKQQMTNMVTNMRRRRGRGNRSTFELTIDEAQTIWMNGDYLIFINGN